MRRDNGVNRTYWDAMAAVHGEGADDYDDLGALPVMFTLVASLP